MNSISNLRFTGSVLSWDYAGEPKFINFSKEVENALVLKSKGIAVVLGNDWNAQAIIFNADGSLRVTLESPFNPEEGLMFYYFNYENGGLILVFAGATEDWKCEVDEETGQLSIPKYSR